MRDNMKPNYLADSDNKTDILDLCLQMALELGDDVFVHQSVALQNRVDQSDTLRGVSEPSLVLCCEDDRLCPVERHQLMCVLIPDAVLHVVKGAGHLPVLA